MMKMMIMKRTSLGSNVDEDDGKVMNEEERRKKEDTKTSLRADSIFTLTLTPPSRYILLVPKQQEYGFSRLYSVVGESVAAASGKSTNNLSGLAAEQRSQGWESIHAGFEKPLGLSPRTAKSQPHAVGSTSPQLARIRLLKLLHRHTIKHFFVAILY
jgi:hypothetical protein